MSHTLPSSAKIRQSTFAIDFNTRTFLTPSGNILETAGRHTFSGSFMIAPAKNSKALEGFIYSLRGPHNVFSVVDSARSRAINNPGTGLVNGAGQTGNQLVTDGWPASQTILKAGELFQCEFQLFEMVDDAVSNGSGQATLKFQPSIRTSPADNTAIITTNPRLYCRLSGDVSFDFLPAWTNEVKIDFEEAFISGRFIYGGESLGLTGYPATVRVNRQIVANAESLEWTEYPAAISLRRIVSAAVQNLGLTTYLATIVGGPILAALQSLGLTSYPATIGRGRTVLGNLQSLSLTENAATVNFNTLSTLTAQPSLATFSTANTISIHSSVQASTDLLVLLQFSTTDGSPPADVTPSGWSHIGTVVEGGAGADARISAKYRVAQAGDAGATVTGMDGTVDRKIILVYRGDGAISTVTPGSYNGYADEGEPPAQSLNAGSGAAPLVAIAHYVVDNTNAIDPRIFTVGGSPAADNEYINGTDTFQYAKDKVYNSSPANISVDMDDEVTTADNGLQSFYLSVT